MGSTPDHDEDLRAAVETFWRIRGTQQQKQVEAGITDAGTRGSVTGGAHMGAIEQVVVNLLSEVGLTPEEVRTRTSLELPGYYRSQKKWDLLVISDKRLIAAVEFKSQVGAFGNNFNNRSEEAIGNAEDLWTAFREGRFGQALPPFVGFFFLLEHANEVTIPVKNAEPYFKVDPIFIEDGKGVSYARRYEILLRRLVLERKYTAACLALSPKVSTGTKATVSFPAEDLAFKRFAASLQGHAVAYLKSR